MTSNNRILALDSYRGLAILLMMVFHFAYDLSYFGYIEFAFDDPFWAWFRYIIVTLFFTVSGVSLVLATKDGIRWKKFLIRWAQVGLGAIAITVSTYFMFPKAWVYFGVLHFIFVAMITGLLFVKRPYLALVLGLTIFVLFNATDWFNLKWLYSYLKPILGLPNATQDITRYIPWFGMILVGIYLGHKQLQNIIFPQGKVANALAFMGKHSLLIYLVHQLILFGLVWAFYLLHQQFV